MRNKLFTALIFLLFVLGISIFVLPQTKDSSYERRGLHINEELSDENLIETSESILKDQFPLRDLSITISNAIRKTSNLIFGNRLLKLKDDVVSINKNIYINEYTSILTEDKETALNKAFNIKSISEKFPDLKTYIYFPTCIEETNLLDNGTNISIYPELKEEFLVQLNENIKTASLNINSEEEFCDYFYNTDRHWNGYGAYQGYKDIVTLISEDFNIGDIKEATFEECEYDFYGNYGANLGYLCNPDHIVLIKKNLDGYDYYVDNVKSLDNTEELYKDNGKGDVPYSDYDVAFGNNSFLRVYDFHQENKPNILIFADSFVNPIKDLLASHFNKTVIVDMRANDGTFDLDKIINENSIDAILFLQYYDNLYLLNF